ncbi:MAG: fimbrillin family protein [Muribaculaceae bacterium]|nr:fimbrillin family protein [Muribaculaceae bacterium]
MAPVKLFDNQTVTKTADGWTYEGTRYWMPGTKYNFYAYSCADVALQSDDKGIPSFEVPTTVTEATKLDERGLKINNYVCDATHQHDLIVAAVEGIDGKNENNDKVHFSFRHALCKVSAEFVNDFPQGYTVTVSDVKLCNFYNKASLNVRSLKDALILPTDPTDAQMKALQDGVWNNQTRFTTEGATETEIAMPIKDNKTDALFMIPVYYDNANLRLEFTITVAQGDDVFLTRKLRGTWKPVWIPGRAYKYEIHINGDNAQLEPIVFETSQDITGNESWGADITTSITFGIAD